MFILTADIAPAEKKYLVHLTQVSYNKMQFSILANAYVENYWVVSFKTQLELVSPH